MKRSIIYLFFLSFVLACTSNKPAITTPQPELTEISPLIQVTDRQLDHSFDLDRLARFDSYLEKEIHANKIPGAVLLIHQHGQEVYSKSFGSKTTGAQLGMPKDELFYIQSMTKPIVSIAFMMLYEEGHFQLTDKVSQYIPEFKEMMVATETTGEDFKTVPAESEITIKQVLSHTAGLSHGLTGTDLDNHIAKNLYFSNQQTIEDRVKTLASLPLIGQPGKQWYYSASPDILARLIEIFTDQTAEEFLQERLFNPLGMTDTGYNIKAGQEARKANLYTSTPDGTLVSAQRQTPAQGHTVFGGTHGLFSTAKDYMKFCDMLLNGGSANGHQFIGRKTLDLMTLNHLSDIPYSAGEGFGLGFGIVTDVAGTARLGSEGTYYWGGAFNTYFFIDPEEDMAAILMMQFQPYTDFYSGKLRQFVYQAMVK